MSKYEYSANIDMFLEGVDIKIEAFLLELTQRVALQIVRDTPVLTGFARASWFTSLNAPNANHPSPPTASEAPNSVPQFAGLTFSIMDVKVGDSVYIMNSAAYINRLEYGHSKQAPQGMVRVNMANIDKFVQDSIRAVTDGR